LAGSHARVLLDSQLRSDKDADMIPRSVMTWFLAFLLAVLMIALTTIAQGAPIAQLKAEGITLLITDEPCQLKAVGNLPYRATWTEKGKTFEGCAGGHPMGIVMFYWDDKSVSVAPVQAFTKVSAI
jgi:hypothetical protein